MKYMDLRRMTEHTNNFIGQGNQLTTMKMKVDEIQVLLLLSSLTNSWKTLVISISNSMLKLPMEIVKDSKLKNKLEEKKKVNLLLLLRLMSL